MQRFCSRVFTALLLSLASTSFTSTCLAADSRPNIIVILCDDMGYSDLGCYGGEIKTRNLDMLAANGLRFTQFYNMGRCCPTRASLLTGLYPHQAGVGHMTEDRGLPGYQGELNTSCVTMAEVLKPAGYGTYAVGKWHVVRKIQPDSPSTNWPLQRGFDRYYGTITGAGSFYDPGTLTRDNTMISPFADSEYRPQQYYYTDAITDHAVRYINEHQANDPEKPFFLYMAYTAAHWPMHALPEDIAKVKGRYDEGYAPIRAARYERMKQLGLIDPKCELSPQAENWETVANKPWEVRCMEVYAAMIERMDQGVGKVVDSLEQNHCLENTLILFMQDNGGCQEEVGRVAQPRQDQYAPIPADAISTEIYPKQTRDGRPVLMGPEVMPGPDNTYIAYGPGWANSSNTPFRLYKHYVHEGGISTPLIAHWPKGIQRKGELERQPGHLIDIMATCIDVGNARYPRQRNAVEVTPPQGKSLVPAFQGQALNREALYWEHEGNHAIRIGNWKLVAKGEEGPWELYDVSTDRAEMHDLAAQQPERVAQMAGQWKTWAEAAQVLPLGGWRAAKEENKSLSKKMRFLLSGTGSLERGQAPNVNGRAFEVRVTVERPAGDGVLVAHGGAAEGWVLYQSAGKVLFAARQEQRLTVISSADPLPDAARVVTAKISANGEVTLAADGKTLGMGKLPQPITAMPIDGLEVGRDVAGSVGNYRGPFPYEGTIQSVEIEIEAGRRK